MPYAPSDSSSTSPSQKVSPEPTVKLEQQPQDSTSSTAWLEHADPAYAKLYRPAELLDPKIYARVHSISELPLIRQLTFRPGKSVHFLHTPTYHGVGNFKAILAYQRGKVQLVPCSCCAGSLGPFQQCVVLNSVGHGACTNCAYDGNSTRCTLRETNVDGTPINPNTHKTKIAVSKEDNGDRRDSNGSHGTTESSRMTPGLGPARTQSPSMSMSNPGYVRRQAAKDAENILSTYKYRATDAGGSSFGASSAMEPALESPGIESPAAETDDESKAAENISIEGWPDLGRAVSDLLQPGAQRPRGSFMAKRGGKSSYGQMHAQAAIEDANSAVATPEELGSESSEDASRRRQIYTSPSPEEEEIHVAEPNSNSAPNQIIMGLGLHEIPIPDTGSTLGMAHLLTLPAKRNIEWKPESTKSLNLKAQVESAMGYCVGDVVVTPCTRCQKGIGAFANCVTVYANFQQACVSCNYTSTAPVCNFHVPQSTKFGTMLEVSPNRPPPKKRQRTKKSSSAMPQTAFSAASHMQQFQQPSTQQPSTQQPSTQSSRAVYQPPPRPEVPYRAPPAMAMPPPFKPSEEPQQRSSRYLKALLSALSMSQEEQQLELADLKFQLWVISNMIAGTEPPVKSSRYKQAQFKFGSMSHPELELEQAGFKFQLSVLQDVVKGKI